MSEQTKPIEEVVEETVQETKTVEQTPQEDASYKEVKKDGTIKLDLEKLKKFQTQNKEENVRKEESIKEDKQEESGEEKVNEEVLQEVTDEPEQAAVQIEQKQEVTEEKITPQPEVKLPENIESLVKFMEETGGTIEEYVRLNADYSDVDNNTLLKEYYKSTKSQDAINFYNEYNQKQSATSEVQQKQYKQFEQSTNNVFNENFKGFDFKVGDKKYRYNVKDAAATKDYQSDISNFVREFLDENDMMKDAAGYHKALYAGRNIDKIVSHFYEQGKADAIKNTAIKSKNIDMDPRTVKPVVNASGMKVKVLGGEDSSRLKFKIRKK